MAIVRITAAPAIGVLLSLALFFQAGDLDKIAPPGQIGPGFWPRLVLAGLGLACLARLIAEARRASAAKDAAPAARPAISTFRLAVSVALILLYTLLAPSLGFALATLGFIAGFMWISGARSWPMILGNVLVGTITLLYLFVKFVYLPLPKGDGLFETLTLALYRALHLF